MLHRWCFLAVIVAAWLPIPLAQSATPNQRLVLFGNVSTPCNGVADDTAAIQSALNGGGSVVLPPSGSCNAGPLTISVNGTNLNLNQSVLKLRAAGSNVCPSTPSSGWTSWCGPLLTIGSLTSNSAVISGVMINNGTIDGNAADQPGGMTNQDGVSDQGGTNLSITGVTIQNFTRNGVLVTNTPSNDGSATVTPGAGIKIANDIFQGNATCIHYEGGMNSSIISTNICLGPTSVGIGIFDTSYVSVNSNTIYNVGGGGDGIYVYYGTGNTISLNSVDDITGNGIEITSTANTISNNTIVGTGLSGIRLGGWGNIVNSDVLEFGLPGITNTLDAITIAASAISDYGNVINTPIMYGNWKYGVDITDVTATQTVINGLGNFAVATSVLYNPTNQIVNGVTPWSLTAQSLGGPLDLEDLWNSAGNSKLWSVLSDGTPSSNSMSGSGSRPACVTSTGKFEAGSLSSGLVSCP